MSILELTDSQKLSVRSFQLELNKELDPSKLRNLALELYVANIVQKNAFTGMLAKEWGINTTVQEVDRKYGE
jgi:hypothetical protein